MVFILFLFLTGCHIQLELQESLIKEMIQVELVHLDQHSEFIELPLYAEMEQIMIRLDCEAVDCTGFNPRTVLKDKDRIILQEVDYRRISINQAGVEELMELPGIGKVRAEQIIAYREQHGYFQSLEELMLVKGIKQASFDKLKDRIKL